MGLKKKKVKSNGIETGYHRVVSVTSIVNHATIIEVCSYISEDAREQERTALESKKGFDVFMDTSLYSLEYNEKFTVKDAYEWLKKQSGFENAEDV